MEGGLGWGLNTDQYAFYASEQVCIREVRFGELGVSKHSWRGNSME